MRRASLPLQFLAASFVLAVIPSFAQQPGVQTLRTSSRIVVVDVVVRDSKGNPVHGLKASDFALREKGQPQTISSFEEHIQPTPEELAKMPPAPKLAPGVFTNYAPVPSGGALNILLLDTLNTPEEAQMVVRKEMLNYLKSPRPEVRMAIFGLGEKLYMLQGFTSDPEVLRKVIEKTGTKSSAFMDNSVNGDTPGANSPINDLIELMALDPDQADMAADMMQFEAEQKTTLIQSRVEATLEALNQLGRYLGTLPGRKNLIWFSGSFPINILPDADLKDAFSVDASMVGDFETTVNLLSRAQVSVYPVDARGLMTSPMLDASTSAVHVTQANPHNMIKDQQTFFGDTASEHTTMLDMAHDTGGKAFVDTNGLKEAVGAAIENGASYYSLTYSPSNKDWKGDYRKIQVDLERKGYTLSYRRGYYADDPDANDKSRKDAAAAPVTFNPIASAMKLGVPPMTEILFSAQVNPVSDASEKDPAPGNHAETGVSGPYRRYSVLFSADPRAIHFEPGLNNTHHVNIRFMVLVYDSQGKLVNSAGQRIDADMPPDRYAAMFKSGSRYKLEISVPDKGDYFLRLGVADLATQHVGALEVPIASVAKLKPLPAKP